MEQAAESVAAAHRPVADGCRESDRALLVEARVRAGVVVVRDVLGQHTPQVRLTGDAHLVQALPRQSRLAIIPNGMGKLGDDMGFSGMKMELRRARRLSPGDYPPGGGVVAERMTAAALALSVRDQGLFDQAARLREGAAARCSSSRATRSRSVSACG